MINDLPNSLQAVESSLFADDSCIFKSRKNLKHINKLLQNNLGRLFDWFDTWGFKISLEKTVAVVFSHRENKHMDLTLSNHSVKIENKVKFLGLIFDSKLISIIDYGSIAYNFAQETTKK